MSPVLIGFSTHFSEAFVAASFILIIQSVRLSYLKTLHKSVYKTEPMLSLFGNLAPFCSHAVLFRVAKFKGRTIRYNRRGGGKKFSVQEFFYGLLVCRIFFLGHKLCMNFVFSPTDTYLFFCNTSNIYARIIINIIITLLLYFSDMSSGLSGI